MAMKIDRRTLFGAALALGSSALAGSAFAAARTRPFAPAAGARSRMVYVNDLSGDLDGLFATVHALLSNTSQVRAIVGAGTGRPGETAEASAALGREIVHLMGLDGKVPVALGAAAKLTDLAAPDRSPGVQAIITEAMRSDTTPPLYVAVGGGLTEVASAILIEPKVAERMTLVWIGGDAFPGGGTGETNFNIDPVAAMSLFNETRVPIWQIPRSAYAATVVSATELQAHVAPHGRIGQWLYDKVVTAPARFRKRLNMGETWTLGDNPLVVPTSLADWVPNYSDGIIRFDRTGSSHFDEVIAPHLNPDGTFSPRTDGRKIRIYKDIDTRLMFGDFFAKLAVNYPAR